jgi:hypothetical protein
MSFCCSEIDLESTVLLTDLTRTFWGFPPIYRLGGDRGVTMGLGRETSLSFSLRIWFSRL